MPKMMVVEMAALLMAAVVMVAIDIVGAQDIFYGHPENYKPHLTTQDIGGKITTSTFVLDQPRCVFNDTMDPSDNIWLVVAENDAANNFTPSSAEDWAYQSFGEKPYYMTLGTGLWNYPCPVQPGDLTLLRVGTETSCISEKSTRPDCNGPLPGPGPYKVKFVAMSDKGAVVETEWSDPITLIKAENYDTIETAPKQRSAGMIAITTILSILFAVLLAALIAALVYKYTNVCGSSDIATKNEPATVTRYTTHHVYDHPPYKL